MASIIDQLKDEHRNLGLLLGILERECRVLNAGRSPHFGLIQLILDYLREYPAISHHAREDALFTCLATRAPDRTAAIGDLLREHEKMAEHTKVLGRAVQELAGAATDRGHAGADLGAYISDYRRHIALEEGYFLPAAKRFLSVEDMEAAARSVPGPDDPAYPGEAARVVEILHVEIIRAAGLQTLV